MAKWTEQEYERALEEARQKFPVGTKVKYKCGMDFHGVVTKVERSRPGHTQPVLVTARQEEREVECYPNSWEVLELPAPPEPLLAELEEAKRKFTPGTRIRHKTVDLKDVVVGQWLQPEAVTLYKYDGKKVVRVEYIYHDKYSLRRETGWDLASRLEVIGEPATSVQPPDPLMIALEEARKKFPVGTHITHRNYSKDNTAIVEAWCNGTEPVYLYDHWVAGKPQKVVRVDYRWENKSKHNGWDVVEMLELAEPAPTLSVEPTPVTPVHFPFKPTEGPMSMLIGGLNTLIKSATEEHAGNLFTKFNEAIVKEVTERVDRKVKEGLNEQVNDAIEDAVNRLDFTEMAQEKVNDYVDNTLDLDHKAEKAVDHYVENDLDLTDQAKDAIDDQVKDELRDRLSNIDWDEELAESVDWAHHVITAMSNCYDSKNANYTEEFTKMVKLTAAPVVQELFTGELGGVDWTAIVRNILGGDNVRSWIVATANEAAREESSRWEHSVRTRLAENMADALDNADEQTNNQLHTAMSALVEEMFRIRTRHMRAELTFLKGELAALKARVNHPPSRWQRLKAWFKRAR